jgi:hypothetical protein
MVCDKGFPFMRTGFHLGAGMGPRFKAARNSHTRLLISSPRSGGGRETRDYGFCHNLPNVSPEKNTAHIRAASNPETPAGNTVAF